MTPATFIYVRVSHRDQANHGESLTVQQSRAEAYAVANGWTVNGVFIERGVSGSKFGGRVGRAVARKRSCSRCVTFWTPGWLPHSTMDDLGSHG
jgi:hypothetical protein